MANPAISAQTSLLIIGNLKKKNEMDTGIESLEDILEDEAKMEKVNSDKYLGDIITADGTNDKNVKARTDKGYGIIDQLMDIFRDYSFGPYFFQVDVMFRNSMFINAILCNSEVWYNLSEANINQLELVDETLIRRIFEYLANKQSLQYRVFQAQLKSPCKGDWTSTVSNDLCELGITLTHQEISRMSKEKFQTFL